MRPATQRILLTGLIVAFGAFTAVSAAEHGYVGFWEEVPRPCKS